MWSSKRLHVYNCERRQRESITQRQCFLLQSVVLLWESRDTVCSLQTERMWLSLFCCSWSQWAAVFWTVVLLSNNRPLVTIALFSRNNVQVYTLLQVNTSVKNKHRPLFVVVVYLYFSVWFSTCCQCLPFFLSLFLPHFCHFFFFW